MEKMDKELNVSKLTLQKLYRVLNKTVPPISKLSLTNIKTNQQLDCNCKLMQKHLSTHQENVKLEAIRNLTLLGNGIEKW